MGDGMTDTTMDAKDSSGFDWQLLGKLTLTEGSPTYSLVKTWLVETLSPLSLNTSLLDKIITSAKLAAEYTLQSPSAKRFKHIHLLVFTSAMHPSNGQTWGFFRIEKIDRLVEEDHAIEFYLYLEGK
jgi:hypothetical protein